ncbi:FEM1B family protein [Megaselia abdita]
MDQELEELTKKAVSANINFSSIKSVYEAAKAGHNLLLMSTLKSFNPEVCSLVLNISFPESDGNCFTPLAIAAINNRILVVQSLLDNFKFNFEALSDVNFDNIVYDASALWCAVFSGNLEIVKLLVQRGAQVNHVTRSKSTPLRAACFQGRLDIVKYLVHHGADINMVNNFNNTCLMISAHRGHKEIVEYLLVEGAEPNCQALCGATALHYAADNGSLEICQLLIEFGAEMLKNEHGMTPVTLAAERVHEELVDLFINHFDLLNKEQKIETFELLGASFANDKDHNSVDKSYQYLMTAMLLRFEDSDNVLRKSFIEPIPAYDNWIECQTIQDLQAIRLNHNSIQMEGLTIRERILGTSYPDLPQHVVYRGAILADQRRFDRCECLWIRALYLRQSNKIPIHRDLLRFAQLYSQMYIQKHTLRIENMLLVLQFGLMSYEWNTVRIANPGPKDDPVQIWDENDQNAVAMLYIMTVITKALNTDKSFYSKSDLENLYEIIASIIKQDVKLKDGQSLLHLVVNGLKPVDEFHTIDVCRFPCQSTANLLLHCGASPDETDCDRNTPLHTLALTNRSPEDFDIDNRVLPRLMTQILKLFLKHGVHLDSVNSQGLKASDLSPISTFLSISIRNTY